MVGNVQAHGFHVTVCHVPSNPDQTLSIDFSALGGHLGHGDSIGPCASPSPSPSPSPEVSPSPSVEPSPSPEPSPVPCEQTEEGCEPSPTPSPEPTVPTVYSTPFSEPSTTENTNYAPKQCPNGDSFKPAIALGGERVDSDTVLLQWIRSTDSVDNYSLIYGYSPDSLVYGIPNLPSTSSEVEVNGVDSRHVWFQIIAERNNGCNARSNIIDP